MANTLIQFREDAQKRQKASAICQQLGTDLISYLRICIDRLNREGGFPFSMTLENQTLKEGWEAFEHASQIAKEYGISDMSLDEINAEIAEARKKAVRYFAVIDTNVIVSAMLNSKSVPGMVVKLALRHTIVPVLNDEILAEYREVLVRPKFHLSENDINKMIKFITAVAVFVDHEHIEIELPDPKDRVFYEVTMQKRITDDAYLVTGNMKHFPKKPFIVTPREMLDIIMKDQLNIEL